MNFFGHKWGHFFFNDKGANSQENLSILSVCAPITDLTAEFQNT